MTTKLCQEQVIEKFSSVHGDRYDYSNVIYATSETKVQIKCFKHGVFEQTPYTHLNGAGCPACGILKRSITRRKDQQEVLAAFNKKHLGIFDYSKVVYTTIHKKVIIICSKHGEFLQTPAAHIRGSGCPSCKLEFLREKFSSSQEKVIEKFRQVHGNKYDYTKVSYKNAKSKVIVICRHHGEFEIQPTNHLLGKGCKGCGSGSPYKKEAYIKVCAARSKGKSNLYIIRCFNENESFYKIGITNISLRIRYARKGYMPYFYEEILFMSADAGSIWQLEKDLHRKLRYFSYAPRISFPGQTECFSEISSEVIKLLESLKDSSQIPLIA